MADGRRDPQGRQGRDRGSQFRLYAAGVAAVLALILILQNSRTVPFNFFFASTETPLFFGLMIAFALGAIFGWLFPRVRGTRHKIEAKD